MTTIPRGDKCPKCGSRLTQCQWSCGRWYFHCIRCDYLGFPYHFRWIARWFFVWGVRVASETNFQAYFLKQVRHGYRTALISGGGFPDCLLIHEDLHSFVELKLLPIGPSGDRKLRPLFKDTQPPWYMEYLAKNGERLYVLFRLEKKYGLLHVTKEFVRAIEVVRYRELSERYEYEEFKTLKELISDHFD